MFTLNFEQRPVEVKKVFQNAENYADFSKLCKDMVFNKVEGYDNASANKVILTKMREVCNLNENSTAYDVRHALHDPMTKYAFFSIISDTVEDTLITGWSSNPFWNRYVEYKTFKLGVTNNFYVGDTTEIVISEISASNHDITRQRLGAGREFSVGVKQYGAKVYMEAERFLMGVEDWTYLVNRISLAYTRLIDTLLHNAVMGAGATLPSPDQWNITCQMQEADRAKFVKLLSDVAIATGSQPIIMGTPIALSQLTKRGKLEYMSEVAKEEIYRTGRIGQFDQYQMVEIPQAFAPGDSSKYLVDDKKLLIMPGNIDKFVKFYDEGETLIREITDRNDLMDHSREYEVVRKFGLAVLTNTRFGTVTIAQ